MHNNCEFFVKKVVLADGYDSVNQTCLVLKVLWLLLFVRCLRLVEIFQDFECVSKKRRISDIIISVKVTSSVVVTNFW